MTAYETRLVLQDPKRLVLENLPLQAGQHITIRITVDEDQEREKRAERLTAFFRELQSLPQMQTVSEDQIAEEIAISRTSQSAK